MGNDAETLWSSQTASWGGIQSILTTNQQISCSWITGTLLARMNSRMLSMICWNNWVLFRFNLLKRLLCVYSQLKRWLLVIIYKYSYVHNCIYYILLYIYFELFIQKKLNTYSFCIVCSMWIWFMPLWKFKLILNLKFWLFFTKNYGINEIIWLCSLCLMILSKPHYANRNRRLFLITYSS